MPALVHAIDVSSHQPRDLSAIIGQHRPAHVVVRMYLPEESPPQEHSVAQVESARANGCSVGAYVWAYRSSDPRETVRDGLALARRCGLEPPVLWIYDNRLWPLLDGTPRALAAYHCTDDYVGMATRAHGAATAAWVAEQEREL